MRVTTNLIPVVARQKVMCDGRRLQQRSVEANALPGIATRRLILAVASRRLIPVVASRRLILAVASRRLILAVASRKLILVVASRRRSNLNGLAGATRLLRYARNDDLSTIFDVN